MILKFELEKIKIQKDERVVVHVDIGNLSEREAMKRIDQIKKEKL